MNAIRKSLGTLAIALAGLALLAPAGAVAASGRTVAVSASATLKVPNDSARVGFGVSAERRSRAAALQATSARLRKVIAAAQAIPGVEAGDVRTGRISVRKTHRGKAVVYRASQGASVTLHQPERAGELVEAGIRAGASGVNGPAFFVGDSEAAYAKALAAAFDKAKARATTLASEAGATLGPALSIVEGGSEVEFAPAPVESGGTTKSPSAPSPPPTKPGTTTVTATVNVVFELL